MGPPRRSLGGAETFKWVVLLQPLQTVVFKEETWKNKNRNETDDPGTQNRTVPKGADKRSTHYLRHILTFFFCFSTLSESNAIYSVSLRCKMAQWLLPLGSFQKTGKYILTNDSEVFWGRQDAVSEGPKPLNGLFSFNLYKQLF